MEEALIKQFEERDSGCKVEYSLSRRIDMRLPFRTCSTFKAYSRNGIVTQWGSFLRRGVLLFIFSEFVYAPSVVLPILGAAHRDGLRKLGRTGQTPTCSNDDTYL